MKLLLTNSAGTYDVTQLVPSIKWSGEYRQAARTLQFALLSSTVDPSIPVVDCPLGAQLQLLSGKTVLFDGFIVNRTKTTQSSQIDVTCFDRGFYLKKNKASYQFQGTYQKYL